MTRVPKLPLELKRTSSRTRDARAGCRVCHGDRAHWTTANAQALAAQHHDRTGHETWCRIVSDIQYGRAAADPRQIDIEDAIASASPGGRPVAAPLLVDDREARQ